MQPNIWAECGLKSEEEEEEEVGAAEEAAAGCRQVVKEGRRARDDGETAAILRCLSSHLSLLDA